MVSPMLQLSSNCHTAIDQTLRAACDDFFFQLEVRNAVDEQSADAVVAIVHGHLIAARAQTLRRGEPRRSRADNADAFAALAARH